MTDDDRPHWLPAPEVTTGPSPWKRTASFMVRLPSLVLISVGIGAAMLAVASLAAPLDGVNRNTTVATAFLLSVLAIACFAVSRAITNTMKSQESRGEHFPSTLAPTAGLSMTTQQFFSALLRALAIWQFIDLIAEAPQIVGLFGNQHWNGQNFVYAMFFLGPVVRLAIALLLFLYADLLARWIYPNR